MSLLTTIGNGAINGASVTLADGDLTATDKLIVFDTSASVLKRVNSSAVLQGAGSYLGDTGAGTADIIRVHENELNTSGEIAANNNGLAAGPLTIGSGTTLTISGSLSVV